MVRGAGRPVDPTLLQSVTQHALVLTISARISHYLPEPQPRILLISLSAYRFLGTSLLYKCWEMKG